MSSESSWWSVSSPMVFSGSAAALLLRATDWCRLLFGATVLWETFIVSGVKQKNPSNYREATKVEVSPTANCCANSQDTAVGAAVKLCKAFSHKTP